MTYKEGDKVIIKSQEWYNKNKDKYGAIRFSTESGDYYFRKEDERFCGRVVTIGYEGNGYYCIDEDDMGRFWIDEMIEGLSTSKCNEGDSVGVSANLYSCQTTVRIKEVRWYRGSYRYKVYIDGEEEWLYDDDIAYENFRISDSPKPSIVLEKKTDKVIDENNTKVDMGEVSDGYHTFNELYEYRMLYNAALFNEFAKQGLYDVHKSRKHSDGEYPFGNSNWFIVMAELPTGQISNHYEMKDWDKFQIPEKPLANKWDGHSPKDVAKRLTNFTNPKKEYPKTYEECCNMDKIDYRLLIETINRYRDETRRIFEKLHSEDLKSKTNIIQYGPYARFERVDWKFSDENNICIRYYHYNYDLEDSDDLVIPASILFNNEKIDNWIQGLITDALKKIEESNQKAELKNEERERLEYERLKTKFEK